MKTCSINSMKGGWFIGDFEPSILKTKDFEVACKYYKGGEKDGRHVHRVATEITLIVTGTVEMNGKTFGSGDVIMLDPGESCEFVAVSDTTLIAVKHPSVQGDKHLE